MVKVNNKLTSILKEGNNSFYIIGETSYNHEGDLQYLHQMVDGLSELGVSAVKFHLLLDLGSYMHRNHPLYNTVKDWLFSADEWRKLIGVSVAKGLEVIALCDDVESIGFIVRNRLPVAGIELHSSCLNDYFMMKELLAYSGIIILGIGGSGVDEIKYAVDFFNKHNKKDLLLMYGFQSYPTDYQKINLRKIVTIKNRFNIAVGYADHTAFDDEYNELITACPYLLGVRVFEKHYTLSVGAKRADYQSAVGNEQFLKLKEYLRLFKAIVGKGGLKKMSTPELQYGKTGPMKKAIVARRNIAKGTPIKLNDLWFKRTKEKSDIKQNQIQELIGLCAASNIKKDEVVCFDNCCGSHMGN